MKALILYLIFLVLATNVKSQTEPSYVQEPRVGHPLPDFEFGYITHYKTSKASLSDFKDQWLFLDFWTAGCTGCIKSLPKINAFQQQFRGEVQFVMIGKNDRYSKGIEELYEGLREKQELDLVVAYDSILAAKWDVPSVPHIIIVDPGGIVRFITSGSDLTSEKIQDMIAGKAVTLQDKNKKKVPYDPGVTNSALIYRSVMSKWNGESFVNYAKIRDALRVPGRRRFQISKIPLIWLYKYAYFGQNFWGLRNDSMYGRVYPFPVFEIQDSSMFERDVAGESGLYNYSLIMPDSLFSEQRAMEVMQRELENIFGYNATVETREVPVWLVTGKPGALRDFKTKGGRFWWTGAGEGLASATGFSMTNGTVENLISMLTRYVTFTEPPILDDTGILDNVDLTIDADLTKIEGVRIALREIGLDLVRGYKAMSVLVIKDPETSNSN